MTTGKQNTRGFTLIELMVAMAIAGIVLASIYTMYNKHVTSYTNQKLVVEMMQNARAAMTVMEREIRMAGYDPSATDGFNNDPGEDTSIDEDDESFLNDGWPSFVTATARSIQFRMNLDYARVPDPTDTDVNDSGEEIRYDFAAADDNSPTDGIPDSGAGAWSRTDVPAGSGQQILAWDVVGVGFAYAVDQDGDGELDTSANNNVLWLVDKGTDGDMLDYNLDMNDDGVIDADDDRAPNGLIDDGDLLGGPEVNIDPATIAAVQIWLLVRTRAPLRGVDVSETFVVGDRIVTIGGGYKGALLNSVVRCRNL